MTRTSAPFLSSADEDEDGDGDDDGGDAVFSNVGSSNFVSKKWPM
jgi:hypothetical protein